MVGVAGPMVRRDARAGTRFILGLGAGYMIASTSVGLLLVVAGSTLQRDMNSLERSALLIGIGGTLALADGFNRTPEAMRQVPVQLFWKLSPWRLGITWGLDLGSLVSTRKTSSLIWMAIVGSILTAPTAALLVCLVFAACSLVIVIGRTVAGGWRSWNSPLSHGRIVRISRFASAATIPGIVVTALIGLSS